MSRPYCRLQLPAFSLPLVVVALTAACSSASASPGERATPEADGATNDASSPGTGGGHPVVTLTKRPTLNMYSVSNVAAPSFDFTVTDTVGVLKSVSCQLDSRAPVDCSNLSFSQTVSEGAHNFTVTAVDMSGASAQSTPFKWTFVDHATQQSASQETATFAANCVAVQPFYWEIGDQSTGSNPTCSGSSGTDSSGSAITRGTEYPIASASKWIFAAYAIQKLSGVMDPVTKKFLHLSSGYTTFFDDSCEKKYGVNTVSDCANAYCWADKSSNHLVGCDLAEPSSAISSEYTVTRNSEYTAANDGFFDYGGGHMQRYAVAGGPGVADPGDGDGNYGFDMGSEIYNGGSPSTSPRLSSDVLAVLGLKLAPFAYSFPQLAGGVATSAAEYATFLQNILNGTLKINAFLGRDPVCTNPAMGCATARYTPIPQENLGYSYGHWVENDPTAPDSDGAFNSAGAFGFYPWIDATKTYYGVVSRAVATARSGSPDSSVQNGYHSELCGRQVRKAFLTGVPQH